MSEPRLIPEELIKLKAHQIWKKRQLDGREGTPQRDWEEAKKYFERLRWEVLLWELRQILTETLQSLWSIPKFILWTLPTSEWIKLLAAPLVLSIAGSIITSRLQEESKKNERLNKYFDKIESLVFERGLLDAEKDSPVRVIAKSRSLTVLRDLDVKRKELVITFLEASNLVNRNNDNDGISLAYLNLENINLYGLNLEGAELRETNLLKANLNRAKLNGADLSFAKLNGANLGGADLSDALLFSADLNGALLYFAKLNGADLYFAKLNGAELNGADLSRAKLSRADLNGAILRGTNLRNARFNKADLRGANLTIAKNITSSQIKSACFWDEAIYKDDNSENQKYIEELKKDTASDPKEPPDCKQL